MDVVRWCYRPADVCGEADSRYDAGMLRELSVQNLALIEDLRVELKDGFCAWTGETGAGKSLLLGAFGLLIGERGSADFIRASSDELRVTGLFELRNDLKQGVEAVLDTTLEVGQVIVSRRLNRGGGSKAYVNDTPVSVTLLRKLGELLVDVHGQRESHSLLEPSYQVQLLDAFGKLGDLRRAYDDAASRVRELRRRRADLSARQETRQRELSLIRFEREELDAARLRPQEQNDLVVERDRLTHAQALQEFAAGAAGRLYDDDGSIVEQLGRLVKEAQHWANIDPDVSAVAKRLEALAPEIRDIAETCRDLSEHFEADPARLDEVERRLQLLRRLEAKYRKPVDELIVYRGELDQRETGLSKDESDLSSIDRELRLAFTEIKIAAGALSTARGKVGKKLVTETQKHLVNLGMPSAKLDCDLKPIALGDDPFTGDVPVGGADDLEFLLAANPGEPARPLRKVASGGELSRTMLALKTVLAAHDPVGTLVFDEIDANVGGRLGDIVGEKLAQLGRTHQVICVTHLPQVAAYAGHQWTIRKATKGKRTATTIVALESDEQRMEELASMMRGEARSATTRQEATELLRAAKKKWLTREDSNDEI
jgi:DNA repair protein RecN (Recombination protein N)